MYVIYSASEQGFWSNEDGWGTLATATLFEDMEGNLPIQEDAEWVHLTDAKEVEDW